jgi:hypothetical protein
VLGDGELEVSGPQFASRWRVHLKGVDFPAHGRLDETLTDELALSANGRRVAAVGHRESAVTVYFLEPRPFLAELARGTFAVAPDARWLAIERRRERSQTESTLDIFTKSNDATYAYDRSIKLPSPPEMMVATQDSLLISRKDAAKTKTFLTERRELSRAEPPLWSVEGRLLDKTGPSGALLVLERPPQPGRGDAATQTVVVRASDGLEENTSVAVAASAAASASGRSQTTAASASPGSVVEDQGTRFKIGSCDIPRAQDQKGKELSPGWIALWNQGSVELLDANCRDFGRFGIAGVSGVGIEGGGKILRIDLDRNQRSMLIPLEREVTEMLGRSLLKGDYTADLCRVARIDCG